MLRYTPRRKAELVAAALKEPSKVEELLKEHGEFLDFIIIDEAHFLKTVGVNRTVAISGRQALRATRVQDFRKVAHA